MIKPATGEAKASRDVFRFEVRQFLEDLLLSESCSKQVQDVDHPNPHATDTGPPSALCRIRSDAARQVQPYEKLRRRLFPQRTVFVSLRSAQKEKYGISARSQACSMIMPCNQAKKGLCSGALACRTSCTRRPVPPHAAFPEAVLARTKRSTSQSRTCSKDKSWSTDLR